MTRKDIKNIERRNWVLEGITRWSNIDGEKNVFDYTIETIALQGNDWYYRMAEGLYFKAKNKADLIKQASELLNPEVVKWFKNQDNWAKFNRHDGDFMHSPIVKCNKKTKKCEIVMVNRDEPL